MSATTKSPSPFKVGEAMRALHEARERILAIEPDMPEEDAKLWRDMMDGESGDAFEVIERLVRASIDADYLIKMVAERQKDLAERKARFDRRKDSLREVAQQMLEIIGTDKLQFADFSVSVGNRPPKIIIIDESAIDDTYIRIRREPDKASIAAAMKAGDSVPGVAWSNSERGMTVRTK